MYNKANDNIAKKNLYLIVHFLFFATFEPKKILNLQTQK